MDKKLRLALAPFKEEWKAFNKEKIYTHHLKIADETGGTSLNLHIRFALKWVTGVKPDIIIKSIKDDNGLSYVKNMNTNPLRWFFEDLLSGSTTVKEYTARMVLFMTETEKMGKKEYDDEDALWLKYFWSHGN